MLDYVSERAMLYDMLKTVRLSLHAILIKQCGESIVGAGKKLGTESGDCSHGTENTQERME